MKDISKWGAEEKETIEAINDIGFSGSVLNIAAGDGRFNDRLLELSQKVTAIDIDNSELKYLKKNCPESLACKLHTKVVDITQKFPFRDATFDGAFCTGTLHLFGKETIAKILHEIKRVLKPGGRMVLDFATDIKRLDRNQKQVVFAGEGNYTTDEAMLLFQEQLQDFSWNMRIATFAEETSENDTGYDYISGEFLIISGIVKEQNVDEKYTVYR